MTFESPLGKMSGENDRLCLPVFPIKCCCNMAISSYPRPKLTCCSSFHLKTMLAHHNCLSSFNPSYQVCSNSDSQGDAEFNFWGACETQYCKKFSEKDDCEIEFRPEFEEYFDDYSPPLWNTDTSSHVRYESSPLLDHKYHYSNISPTSRLQAIAEGRRDLMEMVSNMPESSYELSLKDIVDEQHVSREVNDEILTQQTSLRFKAESQIKKQKRKKTKNIDKPGHISRSASMEKESFLIKMFVPTSLTWKTKVKAGSRSKVSPRPLSDGSENHVDKEWWLKRFLVSGEGKSNGRGSHGSTSSSNGRGSRGSTSSSNGSKSRHCNTNLFLGCWSFCNKKNKSGRQRECAF